MYRREFLAFAAAAPTTMALPAVAEAAAPESFRARCNRYHRWYLTKPGVRQVIREHVNRTFTKLWHMGDPEQAYATLTSYFLYGEAFPTVNRVIAPIVSPSIVYPGDLTLVCFSKEWRHKWVWNTEVDHHVPFRDDVEVRVMFNPELREDALRGGALLDPVDPLLLNDPDFDLHLTDSTVENIAIESAVQWALRDYQRMLDSHPMTIQLL